MVQSQHKKSVKKSHIPHSRELCRVLLEEDYDGVFITNEDDGFVEIGRGICTMLGYSREELSGLSLSDILTEKMESASLAPAGKEKIKHYQCLFRCRDGTQLPVAIKIRAIEENHILWLVHDLRDKNQAEQQFRESEERFRLLAESSLTGIYLIQEGCFRYVNKAMADMFGYTVEELTGGLSITELIHSEDRTLVLENVRRRVEGEKDFVRYVFRGLRKDGSVMYVEVHGGRITYGGKTGVIGTLVDITEQKNAESALRASEERYRALYRENPSMFFTLDREGVVIEVNDFGADRLGYTKEELQGQPFQHIFHPDDISDVGVKLTTCLQNPGEVYHWVLRKMRKDGSQMWGEEYVRSVEGPEGSLYVLVVCQDISRSKQLQAENERLTAQFYQAQKMEAIGHLAGGIAHDFNNLLVPIIGYVDMHLSELSPDTKLHTDLTQIGKAAHRAASLTRQILAFSRQQMLELNLVSLNDIVDEFKSMLERLIGEDIDLRTVFSSALSLIKADRAQIEQVLMNLVINSRDAMPDGGILTIETTTVYLDETYVSKNAAELKAGQYVMLAISDTGKGMNTETQKRIFDPFFTTKEMGRGTGLGLSTVFGIIKQHKGHIGVYSEPEHGTTFKIYLPLADEAVKAKLVPAQSPSSIYGTETVLVVEDEELVRKVVCETLEAHGYDVVEGSTPLEGLKLVADKPVIDLLLTDVVMPEMNGKELYGKLCELYPDSKVLYMSGYTNNVIVHHGLLEEGINFLQKPFALRDLVQKVRQSLDLNSGKKETV